METRPQDRAPDDRPFVFVSMISTVDGRAARDGRSATIGEDADLQRLLDLRTIADAVLIGTGTLRAEGYDRLVRSEERRARRRAAGLAEDPFAVILSRRFDVPWDAGLFQAPEQPVLRARGVRALLSEGGPTVHGALHAAGVVDELYLTVAPLLTGDADEPNIVEGGRLPEAVELELRSVDRAGSELFLRYGPRR